MRRKVMRFVILIIVFLLILSIIGSIFPSESSAMSETIKQNFSGGIADTGRTAIAQIISSVLGVTRLIGAAVAIIILMTIGAKYIIASAGDRADIKKYAINYIIGAIILFGASGLLTLAKNFVDGAFKPTP